MNEADLIAAFELLSEFLVGETISFIGRRGLILLKLGAALDRNQRRDIEDLACLCPTRSELDDLLRWVLHNIHGSSHYPKLPTLLQELGHADLISRFP